MADCLVSHRLKVGEDGKLEGAVPGYLPWIFAVADPEASWWERACQNPKRMGSGRRRRFWCGLRRWDLG
jgi:hypothetical protein